MTVALIVSFVTWLFTGDWLMAASLFVIVLAWTVLKTKEGPPVLGLAFTVQWISVTVGVFYVRLTGRPLEATLASDYEPMVYIGLGCLLALLAGLWVAQYLIGRMKPAKVGRPDHAFSLTTLIVCYTVAVTAVGLLQELQGTYPSLRQPLVSLTFLRLGVLYLLLRRLARAERWEAFAGLLAFEVAIGITGFFANFREPLVMATLALLELFDRRKVRHWLAVGAVGAGMCALGVMWVTVREDYRARFLEDADFAQNRSERFESIRSAAGKWASQDTGSLRGNTDRFVDRVWAIYYPALALARVPKVLPHTNGQFIGNALYHAVTPRIFFPDKPELESDSDTVRKYAGVWVAGSEQGTTIAFGYAAESYVDFGVPIMFVPVFVWGLFIGLVYAGILRAFRYRDMAISVATLICWLALYLFERSWVKTIGLTGTLLIYVGGLTYVLDRLWYEHFLAMVPTEWASGAATVFGGPPTPDQDRRHQFATKTRNHEV